MAKRVHILTAAALALAAISLGGAQSHAAPGSSDLTFIYFNHHRIGVGDQDMEALIPMLARDQRGFSSSEFQQRVFSLLKSSKPDMYGATTIHVNPDRSVTVNLDPQKADHYPVIMGELVYTLTEQGATQLTFPAVRSEPYKRQDVPYPAFTMITPLWRVFPPQPVPAGLIRMDNGTLVDSMTVRTWIDSRAPQIQEATQTHLKSSVADQALAAIDSMRALNLDGQTRHYMALVEHPSSRVRRVAVDALAGTQEDRVLQVLANRMGKEQESIIIGRLAELLVESGKPAFASYGLFHDLATGDSARATAAARKLGEMKDRRAVPELARAASNAHQELRLTAVAAIAQIGDHRQLTDLIAHPEIPQDAKHHAAEALAALPDRDTAQNGLVHLLLNTSGEKSVEAAKTLTGWKEARVVPWLVQALDHQDPQTRMAASQGLGQLGDARALNALSRLSDRPAPEGPLHTEQTIRIMSSQTVTTVAKLAGDTNETVRRLATESLGHHVANDRRAAGTAIPILLERATDPGVPIRVAAVNALGMVVANQPRALPAILNASKDEDPAVRQASARAIGNVDPPHATEELRLLIQDLEDSVRLQAIKASRQRKDDAHAELLLNYNRHGNPEIRAAVIWALADISPQRLHSTLREVFSEAVFAQESELRLAATHGLKVIKDPRVLDIMSVLLQDTDREVQLAAIRAFGDTGYPQALQPLLSFLSPPENIEVRLAAIDALEALKVKDAIPHLQAIAEDDYDKTLQARAKEAITTLQRIR